MRGVPIPRQPPCLLEEAAGAVSSGETSVNNTEKMVSVPRELMQDLYEAAQFEADQRRAALGSFRAHVQDALDKIAADAKAILDQPAEQHQGDPAAFRCVAPDGDFSAWHDYHEDSHAAALVDVQKGLLSRVELAYAHADPAEVERLRAALEAESQGADKAADAMLHWKREADTLRAQLAEWDALLREASEWIKANSFGGTDAIDLYDRLDITAGGKG
jgi:hypothetical protein